MTVHKATSGRHYIDRPVEPELVHLVDRVRNMLGGATDKRLGAHQDAIDWLTAQYLAWMRDSVQRRRHGLGDKWRKPVPRANEDGTPQHLDSDRWLLNMATKAARGAVYRLLRCRQPARSTCDGCRECGG